MTACYSQAAQLQQTIDIRQNFRAINFENPVNVYFNDTLMC